MGKQSKRIARNVARRAQQAPPPPRGALVAVAWTPWQQMDSVTSPAGTFPLSMTPWDALWANNMYQVFVRRLYPVEPFGRITHLSIKRHDRAPVHDWRELQRIKNELVGPEHEAVELYPAESRKLDAANQFHLWVMPAGYVLPFGQQFREVCTPEENAAHPNPAVAKAVQRPFAADDPWNASTGYTEGPDDGTVQLVESLKGTLLPHDHERRIILP